MTTLPDTPITTRAEFRAAVLATVDAAIARDARTLWWVDPDFVDWPLDTPALIDSLTAWLRLPQRRLCLLAGGYETLSRSHPRFAGWRADWAHAVDARVPTETPPVDLHTAIYDDGPTLMRLFERDPPRGRAASDAAAARAERDACDAIWQRSQPGWAVRTLGL